MAKGKINPWDFHRQQLSADFGFLGEARNLPTEEATRLAFEFERLAKQFWLPNAVPRPPRLTKTGKAIKPDDAVMRSLVCAAEYLIAVAQSDAKAAWRAHNSILAIHREIFAEGMKHEREAAHALLFAADQHVREETARKQAGALVYFIQAGDGGPIKIGKAVDVQSRLRGLQTSHHAKLTLLASTEGGSKQERAYHKQFAEHRREGEWFSPHPDILAEITRLTTGGARG